LKGIYWNRKKILPWQALAKDGSNKYLFFAQISFAVQFAVNMYITPKKTERGKGR